MSQTIAKMMQPTTEMLELMAQYDAKILEPTARLDVLAQAKMLAVPAKGMR
jgi:hypothetical protein